MSQKLLPDFAEVPPFPQTPENPPGLDRLHYHPGDYPLVREALMRAIDASPALTAWTHRRPDEPAIALLEGAASVASILGFYQDLYANEAFLGTAQWRESVASLVRLTGYRLSPGLGGRGTFAVEVKGPPSLPIPQNFPIKADLAASDIPAEFETTAGLTAYQHLSRFPVYLPRHHAATLAKNATRFEIATAGGSAHPDRIATADIKKGDQLLLLPPSPMFDTPGVPLTRQQRLQIVKVTEVEVKLGITTVTIEGRLSASMTSPVRAWRVGRSWRHFGWNAPAKTLTPSPSTGDVTGSFAQNTIYWRHIGSTDPNHECSGGVRITVPLPIDVFPLDQEVKDLTAGQTVIVEGWLDNPGDGTWPVGVARRVTDSHTAALTWGGLSGGSSWLVLDEAICATTGADAQSDVRKLKLHETTSPELTLRPVAQKAASLGARPVCFLGTASEAAALKDRRVWFEGPRGLAFERTCTDVKAASDGPALSFIIQSLSPVLTGSFFASAMPAAVWASKPLSLALKSAVSTAPVGGLTILPVSIAKMPTVLIHQVLLAGLLDGLEDYPKFWELQFSAPLTGFTATDFPDNDPVVAVYGNLLDATQGRTQPLVAVGTGDAREIFQSFKLPKSPLTYFLSADATPPEAPELEVYVARRKWKRVPSFYGHGPDEEIYIVRGDDHGESWIQFGDGLTGARLESGINNVEIIQRVGSGAWGPMKTGAVPSAGQRLEGLDKLRLLGVVGGGSAPETAAKAREAAPGKTRSLGRLVGLQDYENEVLALSGVVACAASWDEWQSGMAVKLSVLLESGREAEFSRIRDVITSLQRQRGPRRYPVVVSQAFERWSWLHLHYDCDPVLLRADVEAAIRTALGLDGTEAARRGLFSVYRRRLGQKEYRSRVEGLVQQVPGVRWCQLTDWGRFAPGSDPETAAIPSHTDAPDAVLNCPLTEVLQLHPRHLRLTAAEAPPAIPDSSAL